MSHSRRRFLQSSGFAFGSILTTSPVEMLMKAMTESLIQRAAAEEISQSGARNYINLGLLGAPLRYQFDHWVRSNANDPTFDLSVMTATKFQSNATNITGLEQGYFDYRGTLVPHLFSQSVQTSQGTQKISELLNNMLVIRGYATSLDGHATNVVRQMAPLGGAQSLSGLASDNSKKIFDSVQWPPRTGGYSAFNSIDGKSLTTLAGTRPAHSLLEGFASIPSGMAAAQNLSTRNKNAFELAKTRLSTYIKSDLRGSKILNQNQSNAVTLLKKGIANLDSYWSEAVLRYATIIQNATRATGVMGISDKVIIPDSSLMWRLQSMSLNPGLDLRESMNQTYISYLAEGFALAEYILKENLGSSLEISCDNIGNMQIKPQGADLLTAYDHPHDHHETGAMMSVLIMNQFYRGLSAGLLEFSSQLRATKVGTTDLWSETLVHIVSDFGRSPRIDGSGSDHGFNQMISSVLGGCIQEGPFVVGNVAAAGGQGYAVPIDNYNQSGKPNPLMMASTVSALMRVPHNPYVNLAAPLVQIEEGRVVVKYPGKVKNG